MRVRGTHIQQILLGAALVAALLWNLAHASEINGLRVDAGATGTRAELALDAGTEFKVISLANPHRLVVDLPGTQLRKGVSMPAAAGLVKSVRSGQPVAGTTRIVFDLHDGVVALAPRLERSADGAKLVLEWPGDNGDDPIARIAAGAAAPATATANGAAASAPAAATPSAGAPAGTPVAATGAASTEATTAPAAPQPDPAAASADATSRLIASMRQSQAPAATTASTPASKAPPPGPPPSGNPSSQRAVPPSTAAVPPPSSPIPTTVATGVPTPMPGAEARVAAAAAATAMQDDAPVANPRGPLPAGTRPLVIAIDAGHGGQDPGAVGPTGKREKDITLAIARELARQVNATPGLKAHLVRDGDIFIPLPQRAQRARAAKADMFISVHADAAENRNAKGSSVYVLSLKGASSQRARWLADKENAADLIGGYKVQSGDNVLANVLLDLTQSGQMKASEDAGNHILSGLKRIGNNHKPNIERANFAVLRTSDMPAMLVETAFLSNAEEEKRLMDPKFQNHLARAILDGVNTYFTSQPPPGTLYAARAASAGAAATTIGAAGPP